MSAEQSVSQGQINAELLITAASSYQSIRDMLLQGKVDMETVTKALGKVLPEGWTLPQDQIEALEGIRADSLRDFAQQWYRSHTGPLE